MYVHKGHNVVWLVSVMQKEDDFVHKMVDTWLILWTSDVQHPFVSCRVIQVLLSTNEVPVSATRQNL